MTTPQDRARLRALLSALIRRQENAELLYIPHGEAGQRRMIRALMEMDTMENLPQDAQELAQWFFQFDKQA